MSKYLEEHEKKLSATVARASQKPEVVAILRQHGKHPDDVRAIYEELLRAGAGYYVAEMVIQSPALLAEYFAMKESDTSEERIAFTLLKRVRGY